MSAYSTGSGASATRPASAAPTLQPYAAAGANALTGAALRAKRLVYVPNQMSGTVQVIDPAMYRVVARYPVPASPEHVVPSFDFSRLWVNSDAGNALTPIDPVTGRPGRPVDVRDPYNLYFTTDGRFALVMASRFRAIDVRDARTNALRPLDPGAHVCRGEPRRLLGRPALPPGQLRVQRAPARRRRGCYLGPQGARPQRHPDPWSHYAGAQARRMPGPKAQIAASASAMPQDVRLSPDGRFFMVADMLRNGVWFVDVATQSVHHFVPMGLGAHGLYPSRDARRVFVSNRDASSIEVFDASTNALVTTWRLPGGATPDMGDVTADGAQLWLSGRYSSEVYVVDTRSGKLLHRIPTDPGPHGLLVWSQPGRFSLGHTGNTR